MNASRLGSYRLVVCVLFVLLILSPPSYAQDNEPLIGTLTEPKYVLGSGVLDGVVMSSSGEMIASYSPSGISFLWDTSTGEILHRFEGPPIRGGVAFSPDETLLAVAHKDSLSIWNLTEGNMENEFSGWEGGLNSPEFFSDGYRLLITGQRLASEFEDRYFDVVLLNVNNGAILRGYEFEESVDKTFLIGTKNQFVAICDGTLLRLVDIQTGQILQEIHRNDQTFTDIAILADENQIVAAFDAGPPELIDLSTGETIRTYQLETASELVYTVSLRNDGKQFISKTNHGAALWNIDNEKRIADIGMLDGVSSLQFSPDGNRILGAHNDTTARLWNPGYGQAARSFTLSAGDITHAAIAPNGGWIAAGRANGALSFYKLPETDQDSPIEPWKTWQAHEAGIHALAVTADGEILGSAGGNGTVKLWNTSTGTLRTTLIGAHTTPVHALAFSMDSQLAVTGDENGTAALWDVETGSIIKNLVEQGTSINAIAFSPDNLFIAIGTDDSSVQLFNAASGELFDTFSSPHGEVLSLEFNVWSNGLLIGYQDGTSVERLLAFFGQLNLVLEGETPGSTVVSHSPDGAQQLLTILEDGCALYEPQKRIQEEPLHSQITFGSNEGKIQGGRYTQDGTYVVTVTDTGKVTFGNAKLGELIREYHGHNGSIRSIALSPDGKKLAAGGGNYRPWVALWDVEHQRLLHEFEVHTPVYSAITAFSPDGDELLFTDGQRAFLAKADTYEIIQSYSIDRGIRSIAFSSDGSKILTGHSQLDDVAVYIEPDEGALAILWDKQTAQVLHRFDGHSIDVTKVLFSPDGSKILTAKAGGPEINVWDSTTGELLYSKGEKTDFRSLPPAVAVSPNGVEFLTGNNSNDDIMIYEIDSGEFLRRFPEFGTVQDIVYSPNGTMLAATGPETFVCTAQGGELLYRMQEDISATQVQTITFSSESDSIAVGLHEGITQIWEIDPMAADLPAATPTPTPTPRTSPPEEQLPILSGPEAAGLTPLTGDVPLWTENGGCGGKYWRAEADTLSNGNAIVIGGMRMASYNSGSPVAGKAQDMIAIFSSDGELIEPSRTAFFTDNGVPWESTLFYDNLLTEAEATSGYKCYGLCADTIAGRSGGHYAVQAIVKPWAFVDEFPQIAAGFEYLPSRQFTAIQILSDDGVPQTALLNPYGSYLQSAGFSGNLEGGAVRFLSNGNLVITYEDDTPDGPAKEELYGRTGNKKVVAAVILDADGRVVKAPFAVSQSSSEQDSNLRYGLTSGDGWFAIRYFDAVTGPTLVAFDNDGNEIGNGEGRIYIDDFEELYDYAGRRGDFSDLEAYGNNLYVTHRGADHAGYISWFEVSQDGLFELWTDYITDHGLSNVNGNADLGIDSKGNIIVVWEDHSWERFQPGRWEVLARLFRYDLEPLTPSFCLFEVGNNTDFSEPDSIFGAGRTKQPRVAMNDNLIIAIAQTNEPPYGDPSSIRNDPYDEWYTYTYIVRMLENPFRPDVEDWWFY